MTDINRNEAVAPVANDRIDALYRSTVVDSTGDKIGTVGQVYLDDVTNEPTWVTVNTGFLGLKESFIPMDKATVSGETITVPFEKDFIKGAPAVDPDGHIDEAQEQELYRYYNMQAGRTAADGGVADRDLSTTDRTLATDVSADRDVDLDRKDIDRDAHLGDETVLREERLNVGKEQVETGRARIRKHVLTEHQQVEVPVTREELVVERTPLAQGERVAGNVGDKLGEGEQEIVLHEERPVISKETVATEKVNVGTREVVENKTVGAEVGKEEVEVVRDVNTTDGRLDTDRDGGRNLADKAGDFVQRKTDGNPNT